MQYDVFISYSRKDYVDSDGIVIKNSIVTKIKDVLKDNDISFWFDDDGINSGDAFAQLITNSIKNASVLLFISSANSNKSEWTRKEIATAIANKKKIIPFKIDETPFDDSISLYLADLDFISYSEKGDKAFQKIVQSIRQYKKSESLKINSISEIGKYETELDDLSESRKLVLIEIEKTKASLDVLKNKHNDIANKINETQKILCKIDTDRQQPEMIELLENDKKAADKKEIKKTGINKAFATVAILLLVYAIFVTINPIGTKSEQFKTENESEVVITQNVSSVEENVIPDDNQQNVTAAKTEAKSETKHEAAAESRSKTDFRNKVIAVKGIDIQMIAVNGGSFYMGATNEQNAFADDNEKPVHKVTLDDFYIASCEVTQGLWLAVMGNTVSNQRDAVEPSLKLRGEGSDYPMYYVSYEDCKRFIKKLNALTGNSFRLPTEAEWEYAARGGSQTDASVYCGGNTIDVVGWYETNSQNTTHAIRMKAANQLGLYDMSGNVSEWCSDIYEKYSSSSLSNPQGASSGYEYVTRGGNWASSPENCRCTSRTAVDMSIRTDAIGFRLAMD